MPKHRIHFKFEVTGHLDIDYLGDHEDPVKEFRSWRFEEVLNSSMKHGEWDVQSRLLTARAESRDPALVQLAREAP